MNEESAMEEVYEADGQFLTKRELGLALYHISRNTHVSREYTLKFVSDVLLRASTLLLEAEPAPEDEDEVICYEPLTEEEISRILIEDGMLTEVKTSYCEYHGVNHEGNIDHECPNQVGKNCGCCSAGRQRCMKLKVLSDNGFSGGGGTTRVRPILYPR